MNRPDQRLNRTQNRVHFKNQGSYNRPVKIYTGSKMAQGQNFIREKKVAKNLEHMVVASHKKRKAQAHYYGQVNSSPMNRNNNNAGNNNNNNNNQNSQNNRNSNRLSVTQRIGNGRKRFSQQQPAQQRQQRARNNTQLKPFRTTSGEIKYLRPIKKKVRPTNVQVRVDNRAPLRHHVSTNPNIQREIRMLQSKNGGASSCMAPVMLPQFNAAVQPPTEVVIMTTGTTLNERFSNI